MTRRCPRARAPCRAGIAALGLRVNGLGPPWRQKNDGSSGRCIEQAGVAAAVLLEAGVTGGQAVSAIALGRVSIGL